MVIRYLDFIVDEMLPAFLSLLNGLMLTSTVSWLGFIVVIILLSVVIGAILLRV